MAVNMEQEVKRLEDRVRELRQERSNLRESLVLHSERIANLKTQISFFEKGGTLSQEEQYRRELWIKVAVTIASFPRAMYSHDPGDWADKALKAYDTTFNKE